MKRVLTILAALVLVFVVPLAVQAACPPESPVRQLYIWWCFKSDTPCHWPWEHTQLPRVLDNYGNLVGYMERVDGCGFETANYRLYIYDPATLRALDGKRVFGYRPGDATFEVCGSDSSYLVQTCGEGSPKYITFPTKTLVTKGGWSHGLQVLYRSDGYPKYCAGEIFYYAVPFQIQAACSAGGPWRTLVSGTTNASYTPKVVSVRRYKDENYIRVGYQFRDPCPPVYYYTTARYWTQTHTIGSIASCWACAAQTTVFWQDP